MTKQDIIDHLTHNCGLRGASSIAAVNGIIEVISESLAAGEPVYIRGFATLKPETRSARTGRDFKSGQPVEIPAQKFVKFIIGKDLKEQINSSPLPY